MSKKIAPRVQLNFAPEEVIDEDSDIISTDINGEAEEELSLPVSMPEVIERKEIVENDIFDNINPSLNGLNEDLIINEIHDEPPPAPKPRKKTGRKLSEEHAAKLALAREKALATRRKNAEEKKRMKEIENKTKELKKKKAVKELEELKDEVDNDKPVKSTPSVNQQSVNMFSKKDLEDAQLEAIIKYETIRKARKEEKKKQQMIDQQKEQLKQKIAGYGAKDTNGRLINRWDRCY
jgi:hypothetical protein